MLAFAQTYSKEIAAILAVLLGFLLNQGLRPKAKLVYGTRSAFTFIVNEPLVAPDGNKVSDKQTVQTASIAIKNAGRESAENVEVAFNWRPQFLNVWPARHFEERPSPLDRHSVVFPSLAPRETVQMEIMAINAALPGITALRSDQSVAKEVQLQPQQVYPAWVNGLFVFLLTLGLASFGYSLVWIIQFISSATPH